MFYKSKHSLVFLFTAILFGCGSTENNQLAGEEGAGFDASKSDAKAIEIVDQMWKALGGKDNWHKARYFSYNWIVAVDGNIRVNHRHDWDRATNRYRVEGTGRDGKHFVTLFDTETKDGDVYLDGKKVSVDSTKKQLLEQAYGSFINDSYWLLMPYKLNDPGVILNYDGEKEIDGKNYDVVRVTFAGVGLTPGDTYWAYIAQDDRLMHKWEYILQGADEGAEPSGSWWTDWQEFGGIKLAMNKVFEGRPVRIYFENVVVSDTPDDAVFQLTSKTF